MLPDPKQLRAELVRGLVQKAEQTNDAEDYSRMLRVIVEDFGRLAVPHLRAALMESNNPQGRRFIAMALGSIRPVHLDAIFSLGALVKDSNEQVRVWVCKGLGKAGAEANLKLSGTLGGAFNLLFRPKWGFYSRFLARECAGNVAKALTDKSADVRLAACEALGRLGPHAKKHIQTLRRVGENDPTQNVREVASAAASQIEGA